MPNYQEKHGKGDEFIEDGKCACGKELGEHDAECNDCFNKRVWCEENDYGVKVLLEQENVEYTPKELEGLTVQAYEQTLLLVQNFKKRKILENLVCKAAGIYKRIGA